MSHWESDRTIGEVLDELYCLNAKVERLYTMIEKNFKSLDLKKIKRNRTPKNRCQFVNEKKGKPCSGYICKRSKTLCYAHHIRANTPKNRIIGFDGYEELVKGKVDLEVPELLYELSKKELLS